MTQADSPNRLSRIIVRLWPQAGNLPVRDFTILQREVVGTLYGMVLFACMLGWLTVATDRADLQANWLLMLSGIIFIVIINQLSFFWILRQPDGETEMISGNLSVLIGLATLLIVGPGLIWMLLLAHLFELAHRLWQYRLFVQRWNVIRNSLVSQSTLGLSYLSCYYAFMMLGGSLPPNDLGLITLGAMLGALLVFSAVLLGCFALLFLLQIVLKQTAGRRMGMQYLTRFIGLTIMPPLPFALLGAVVYSAYALTGYLFWCTSVVMINLIAHWLSKSVAASDQRREELARLEALGRSILTSPPELAALPTLLVQHVSGMFRERRICIGLFDGQILLRRPADEPVDTHLLAWLAAHPGERIWQPHENPPWPGAEGRFVRITVPIRAVENEPAIGMIFLELGTLEGDPESMLPALQTLGATIVSAIHRVDEHRRTLRLHRFDQELAMAGQIQASFLPTSIPAIPGWQLTATLRPARETSGDFYDLLLLPGGGLGLIIADVADKGTGAALFMALSRTLLRTYAFEYRDDPASVLRAANERILMDTDSTMFVTVFYGILDPATGTLRYANAGHNPPFLLRHDGSLATLTNTGVPLGIDHERTWATRDITLAQSDVLVIYTDGITEAQNEHEEMFETRRLLTVARTTTDAHQLQEHILDAVTTFAGNAAQSDDIALLILARH
ncbi:PP2C family protein-serine/threonine phosphatase [Candidatus Chloroploca sp. Khr17]|uniref:PP2C family protein-serine/threonine phosphatase n=1 Tax=Candidatus Chloroploca sp. Khr17 TaxID=2496869 RepID=UPI00101DCFC5|nr:PP2C family protein-serine/threonine phosphatase [Candidatus Chloroploca sp. Khr17]